jgi:hypothetical protein
VRQVGTFALSIQPANSVEQRQRKGTAMTYKQITKSSEEANEYCHLIVHEVLALEELMANGAQFDDGSQNQQRELWIELAESVGEEPYCYEPAVIDYINLYCLEFVTLGECSSATNEWTVAGARLLRTYGGPNAFIEWHDTDFIVIQVYWGSEVAKVRVLAPNVAASLAEIANIAP